MAEQEYCEHGIGRKHLCMECAGLLANDDTTQEN